MYNPKKLSRAPHLKKFPGILGKKHEATTSRSGVFFGSMSVDRTFMGRVFLPPAPSAELHVNIGWNTVGNQAYPEWMPLFGEAISKPDYESLIAKIKTHLEANAIPMWQVACGMCPPTCLVGGACCLYLKASAITKELGKIGDEFNGARVELYQATHPSGFGNLQAFDQYGQPLMKEFGRSEHRAGCMKPCWPPLGYNIILKAPRSFDLRSVWPGVSQSAANVQIPAPMSMGPVTHAAAPAASGAVFCSQCGGHLEAGAKFCAACGARV
jgi:hypothetical protein